MTTGLGYWLKLGVVGFSEKVLTEDDRRRGILRGLRMTTMEVDDRQVWVDRKFGGFCPASWALRRKRNGGVLRGHRMTTK